jgi:hypothetical protein
MKVIKQYAFEISKTAVLSGGKIFLNLLFLINPEADTTQDCDTDDNPDNNGPGWEGLISFFDIIVFRCTARGVRCECNLFCVKVPLDALVVVEELSSKNENIIEILVGEGSGGINKYERYINMTNRLIFIIDGKRNKVES